MSNAIFPSLPGLIYNVMKSSRFNTVPHTSPNLYEVRIAQTVNPVWTWTLMYDVLSDDSSQFAYPAYTAYQTLRGFLLARRGSFDDFLYPDPTDNWVGPAMVPLPDSNGNPVLSPNVPHAQLQVVNDGAGNYYSPLQRNMGGQFFEDITDLDTTQIALSVYANGTMAGNYTVMGPGLALPNASYMGLYLKWAAQPAEPITAQFHFFHRVRFDSDTSDIEQFDAVRWTIGGSQSQNGSGSLVFSTSRPNPL